VAERLGVDMTPFEGPGRSFQSSSASASVIQADISSREHEHAHDDVLFVATRKSIEVTKFLQYLNVGMGTVGNGINLASDGWHSERHS